MNNGAYIVSSVRTAVGKAKRGTLRNYRPEDMGAEVIKGALGKVKGLEAEMVDDILMGCAMPEGEQGMNMARLIALRAGFPDSVSAATVNRFCSSGLQTIAMASQAIMAGHAEIVMAGGAESMSLVPMSGYFFSPHPEMVEKRPEAYLNMGTTAENVARSYNISREEQDAYAYRSHSRAVEAIEAGKYEDEIIPLNVSETVPGNGKTEKQERLFKVDEGPRADTNPEALSGLRPAFNPRGSVTAGNSSQMSDGAAATVVMSKAWMDTLGLKPMARLVGFATAGVPPEIMGIGPVNAIPKVLNQTGLKLQDIGLIELNEAFASQTLAVIQELGLDEDRVNVNGGAIALGHPLGCTGAKLTASLLHEMQRRSERYGICTMCVGGGMGAAAVFENLML
ncbi:MAG: acetyl-CoA C-acyltransferase [Balneolales bacterium]